jgi:hypothetical protein
MISIFLLQILGRAGVQKRFTNYHARLSCMGLFHCSDVDLIFGLVLLLADLGIL